MDLRSLLNLRRSKKKYSRYYVPNQGELRLKPCAYRSLIINHSSVSIIVSNPGIYTKIVNWGIFNPEKTGKSRPVMTIQTQCLIYRSALIAPTCNVTVTQILCVSVNYLFHREKRVQP